MDVHYADEIMRELQIEEMRLNIDGEKINEIAETEIEMQRVID